MRGFRAGGSAGFALAAASVSLAVCLCACDGDNPVSPNYENPYGAWINDTVATLDRYAYGVEACSEVFPQGSASADTLPAGTAAWIRIITTACYALNVRVVGADSDTIRTFSTRFALFNRSEGEKARGVSSYVAWDGRDDQGNLVGPGRYQWRMEFDFGLGRVRRYRADIFLP